MPETHFDAFALDERLQRAIERLGFSEPTPIQARAMQPLLDGRDVIGRARTGSGKTAAFGLPLLQRVKDAPGGVRALVVTPTRELAIQVAAALDDYGAELGVRTATVYGGASYGPQLNALRRGASVVVGTPGRLTDLADRGALDLSQTDYVVLDEADEMLRMGFVEDIEKLLAATTGERQVALFSATMPNPIRRLAATYLRDPIEVQVESGALTVEHIEQHWIRVPQQFKLDAAVRVLDRWSDGARLVFCRTRAGCGEAAEALAGRGIAVEALHGDLGQATRERVVARLRSGSLDVVIATDVAARGLDVERITHVINLDLPPDAESYVHRIGRTGRAGRHGVAISFVTPSEVSRLRDIERQAGTRIAQMIVPTDAEIVDQQVARLRDVLGAAIGADDFDAVRERVRGILEETGWSAEDVAAAGLGLLAAQRGVQLSAVPNVEPPPWGRPPPPPRNRQREDDVELLLFTEHCGQLRVGDIVGALINELGVPRDAVGRVNLGHKMTFVGMPRSEAERVLASATTLPLRGQDVRMVLARPRRPPEFGGKPRHGGPPGPRPHGGKGPPAHGRRPFRRKAPR